MNLDLPCSVEAEQSVLGGLMLDNTAWEKVSSFLFSEHFYLTEHRIIYAAITQSIEDGFDVLTISDYLEYREQLEQVGGLAYLAQITKDTPGVSNIVTYAKVVKERYTLREVHRVSNQGISKALMPDGENLQDIIDDQITELQKISKNYSEDECDIKTATEVLRKSFERLREAAESKADFIGLATGFGSFDRVSLGLEPGDFVIVGGRPQHGKTSFAMNVAENVAVEQKKGVMVFSMEMTDHQLMNRMLASHARVPLNAMRTGKLSEDNWTAISMSMGEIKKSPLYIVDAPALNIRQIAKYAKEIHASDPLSLIVIDYIQLMRSVGRHDSRNYEIGEISAGLKELAKELQLPIIALAQLSREIEKRKDKRPLMSDLRDSGSLEQDADLIVFIYRDEVYNKASPKKGIADVIFGKHRNGLPEDIQLNFLGQYTKFQEVMDFSSGDNWFDNS